MSQISNALHDAHRAKMRALDKKHRYKREREEDTLNKILMAVQGRGAISDTLDKVATSRLSVSPSSQFTTYLKESNPEAYENLVGPDGLLPEMYAYESDSVWGQTLGEKFLRGVSGIKELPQLKAEYKGYIEDYKTAFDEMKDSDEFQKAGNLRKQVRKQLTEAGYKGSDLDSKTVEVMRDEYDFKMEDSIIDPKTGKAAGKVLIKEGEIDDLIQGTDWTQYSPKSDKERTTKVGDLDNQENLVDIEVDPLEDLKKEVTVPFGHQGDKNWSYKRDSSGRLFAQKKGEENWIPISESSKAHKSITEKIESYEDPGDSSKSSITPPAPSGSTGTDVPLDSTDTDISGSTGVDASGSYGAAYFDNAYPDTGPNDFEINLGDTSTATTDRDMTVERWRGMSSEEQKAWQDKYRESSKVITGDPDTDSDAPSVIPSEVDDILPENEDVSNLDTTLEDGLSDEKPDHFERSPAAAELNAGDTANVEDVADGGGAAKNLVGKTMKAANTAMAVKGTYDDVKALFGDESQEQDDFHKVKDKTSAAVGLAQTGAQVGSQIASKVGAEATAKTLSGVASKLGPVGAAVSVSGDVYDMFKEDSSVTAEQRTMSGITAGATAVSTALLATNFWNPIGWAAGIVAAGISVAKGLGFGSETWQGRRNNIQQQGTQFADNISRRSGILQDTKNKGKLQRKATLGQSFLYG